MAQAQEKTFEREYTYKASEMDSKVSCRAIATNQLRSILLNEIGVYVESESILKTTEVSGKFSQDFVENIATISAGITKLQVLDETWNGETFWLKAAITIDTQELEKSLVQLANNRQKVKELEELKNQLRIATTELEDVKRKLATKQSQANTEKLSEEYNNQIKKLTAGDYFITAWTKHQELNYRGAIEDYTQAIELNPEFGTGYELRGVAKADMKNDIGAIEDYSKAIELNHYSSTIYILRGASKYNLNDYNGAIEDFNKSIDIDSQNANAFGIRAMAKYGLKDNYGALSDCDKAIMLDPKDPSFYLYRGSVQHSIGNYQMAIEDYSTSIDLDSKSNEVLLATRYFNRGLSRDNLRDYSGAIKDYSTAINLSPEFAEAYYLRAIAKGRLRDFKGSCSDLRIASELGYSEAYETMRKVCN